MGETDVAVVGGGMFGVAAALELAESGYSVTVFEQRDDILSAASYSNQWRLHRGYHYPQSMPTATTAKQSEPKFRERFEEAVITGEDHYYAIAKDSWVSTQEYLDFCDDLGVEYERAETELVADDTIAETLLVEENHVSVDRLKQLCWDQLTAADIEVKVNNPIAQLEELEEFDYTVISTYASSNGLLPPGHPLRTEYRFEICEVPIVQLPERYYHSNIIVVYGPFMSTDHWGDSNLFSMGDYHHMVHHSNVGYEPEIPDGYARVLNKGLIKSSPMSNWDEFKEHGQQFIPGIKSASHVGSLYTIRAKLPDVEDTDARPSVVRRTDDVIAVFGGKLSTSVEVGKKVVRTIK